MTPAMGKMLRAFSETGEFFGHLKGRSAHGGGHNTLHALKTHGYVEWAGYWRLTVDGMKALGRDPQSDAATKPT